jgi:hypothetical protein
VIDIPCKEAARYVIVETTYQSPEAANAGTAGAVLEICEIEVYGNVIFSFINTEYGTYNVTYTIDHFKCFAKNLSNVEKEIPFKSPIVK